MVKRVKLTVLGEDWQELSKPQRVVGGIVILVTMAAIILAFAFFWAWVLNDFLGFIDLSYGEWVKVMVVYYYFTLGQVITNMRIMEGIKSVLRRV